MELNKSKFWIGLAIAFVLGWGISYFVHTKSVRIEDKRIINENGQMTTTSTITEKSVFGNENTITKREISNTSDIPDYVLETLEYIREHHTAPSGYVGGRVFQNREGQLPKMNARGNKIKYQEWDVHPKTDGQNRGVERLVTSEDDDAYFTSDHYRSFKKIN